MVDGNTMAPGKLRMEGFEGCVLRKSMNYEDSM